MRRLTVAIAAALLVCAAPAYAQMGGGGLGGGDLAFAGGEVGGGDLEGLEQEAGAFEVDLVAGEAGGDVADGFLDGVAVGEVLDEEGVVFEDGADVFGAVLVAHEFVVHGAVAAAVAVVVGAVQALVSFGRLAEEV